VEDSAIDDVVDPSSEDEDSVVAIVSLSVLVSSCSDAMDIPESISDTGRSVDPFSLSSFEEMNSSDGFPVGFSVISGLLDSVDGPELVPVSVSNSSSAFEPELTEEEPLPSSGSAVEISVGSFAELDPVVDSPAKVVVFSPIVCSVAEEV